MDKIKIFFNLIVTPGDHFFCTCPYGKSSVWSFIHKILFWIENGTFTVQKRTLCHCADRHKVSVPYWLDYWHPVWRPNLFPSLDHCSVWVLCWQKSACTVKQENFMTSQNCIKAWSCTIAIIALYIAIMCYCVYYALEARQLHNRKISQILKNLKTGK